MTCFCAPSMTRVTLNQVWCISSLKRQKHCRPSDRTTSSTWTFGITDCGYGRKCLCFSSCSMPHGEKLTGLPCKVTSKKTRLANPRKGPRACECQSQVVSQLIDG